MLGLANVLTLSCKKPPSAQGLAAAWWPPRLNEHRRERSAAAMPPCSLEPPEAAPPPGQRSGGFLSACEGSWAAYLAEVMIQAFVAALTTELRRCNPQHATLLNGQVHLARRCSCGQ